MNSYNDIQKMLDDLKVQTAISFAATSLSDFAIPDEISLIQNQYDIVCNELKKMKTDLNERINVVDKTELIMNVLNYKTYEITYNFREKMDSLKEAKENLMENTHQKVESEIALKLVEIEKEITECENLHESQMRSIKEQKLEAQKQYEDVVNALDNRLENIQNYYDVLLLLIQAEKEQLSDLQNEMAEVKHSMVLEGLQKDIDHFTELQTGGWRTKKPIEEMSVLLEEKGLKFTNSGLLVTKSGHRITYEEAREQNLLDDMTFSFDLFVDKLREDAASRHSKDSKGSDYSRMSSDDVQYLKENLGMPLTLALAEITAVQPKDPIHYLGHWLFKYRYNQEVSDVQKMELEQIRDERERIAQERWRQIVDEEAKAAVLECILRAEKESARKEILRIAKELEDTEEEEGDPWNAKTQPRFADL